MMLFRNGKGSITPGNLVVARNLSLLLTASWDLWSMLPSCQLAEEQKFVNILHRDDENLATSKFAKQMTKENQGIVGDKCVHNDHGSLASRFSTLHAKNTGFVRSALRLRLDWEGPLVSGVANALGSLQNVLRNAWSKCWLMVLL